VPPGHLRLDSSLNHLLPEPKLKHWTVDFLGLLAFAGFLCIGVIAYHFLRWRAILLRKLTEASVLVHTQCGMIEYADVGSGTPIVMLHGTPGGYDQVLSLVNATRFAGSQVRAIIPSRPGYLRTPIESGKTPAHQAALYAALLNELGIERVFVLGVSGGGPSALQFAILFPERCLGLILEEAVTQKIVAPTVRLPAILVDFLIFAFRGRVERSLKQKGIVDHTQITLTLEAGDAVAAYSKRRIGMNNDLENFAEMDEPLFGEISSPTLIVHGTKDTEVPIAHADLAHARIANSQLELIEGADHAMPGSHYIQVNSLIKEFLSQNARPALLN